MMKGKSFLVLVALFATSIPASAVELDVELGADFLSRYVWRGQAIGHKGVLQPSATIGKDGFSFNIWGNIPLDNVPSAGTQHNFQEIDYTLDYTADCDTFSYSAGYIIYTFPTTGGVPATSSVQEAYVGGTLNTLLSPTVTAYHTTTNFHGWYVNAAVSHSLPVLEGDCPITLDLSASLGWGDKKYNNNYWTGTPGESLNDVVVSASAPVEINENLSVVPTVSYIGLVENKIKNANGFSGKNEFIVGGVSVVAAF